MKKLLLIMLATLSINVFATTLPLEIVVPRSPGGLLDVFARHAAVALAANLNREVLVVNRPGGDGQIAYNYTAENPNNRIMVYSSGAVASEVQNPNIGYSYKSFDLVAPVVIGPSAFLISNQLGVNTFKEFVALARKKNINCGSSAPWNALVQARLFDSLNLSNIQIIQYKGSSELATQLAGGVIDCTLDGAPLYSGLVADNKIKLLVTNKSSANWPNAIEFNRIGHGFKFSGSTWVGLGILRTASLNTRATVIVAINQLHQDPTFINSMLKQNISAVPPESEIFIANEFTFYQDGLRKSK